MHLCHVDSAISVRVLGVNFFPHCLPGGLQALTPRTPWSVEVANDCMHSSLSQPTVDYTNSKHLATQCYKPEGHCSSAQWADEEMTCLTICSPWRYMQRAESIRLSIKFLTVHVLVVAHVKAHKACSIHYKQWLCVPSNAIWPAMAEAAMIAVGITAMQLWITSAVG